MIIRNRTDNESALIQKQSGKLLAQKSSSVCTKCYNLTLRWDGRSSRFLRVLVRMYLAHKITHNAGIIDDAQVHGLLSLR